MTKEKYLEMCDAIGSEPIEEEIPIEQEDLSQEIIYILEIYNYLDDKHNPTTGQFLGKVYNNVPYFIDLYKLQGLETQVFTLLKTIDEFYVKRSEDKVK